MRYLYDPTYAVHFKRATVEPLLICPGYELNAYQSAFEPHLFLTTVNPGQIFTENTTTLSQPVHRIIHPPGNYYEHHVGTWAMTALCLIFSGTPTPWPFTPEKDAYSGRQPDITVEKVGYSGALTPGSVL